MKRELTFEADDKNGMTLDELASFVQAAMKDGVPGDARPKVVTTGFSARIRKLRVEAR